MSKGAHFRHRADANHWEILRELKKVTVVRDIHHSSGGMGDILARHVRTKLPVFLEVKSKRTDELTETEAEFAFDFPESHFVVFTVEDAFLAIGVDTAASHASLYMG